jgi:hypothetical protein
MYSPSPVAHCQIVIYVAYSEGHSSFADHDHALRLHLHFFWDIPSRKGEYVDIVPSLRRCIAFEDVDGSHGHSEESIVIVLTTKKEHSMDTIRWQATLMR